ncbi:LolA family protein [Maridesulfovibrio salexigens]|uniref:Outer membrane lipoprotein carrier protein LolA n=1 Tax=Maridesulfovibrio salexigens (strain ATCC 14822 / DSM 2638 / NCIMB 8403 / VKM B-1763) TaxID=526222 RepID=C6BXP1_MARSD|nr:outer membrane lipoprotein carrier protein LolA [Maridesulfovibrio salexigens]ACS78599.1 outer membrane lipoprotein carrier protein LolA [Maridesulfovibrio salexigens DSM 2638]
MAIVKKTILLTFLLLVISASNAIADRQSDFLKELQTRSQSIKSISSDFTQQSHITLFAEVMEAKGKFCFARPNNLRWEYTAPFVSGFLLKGQKGLKWDGASKESTQFNTETSPEMAIISEQILAWTTMDIPWLQSLYSIKVTNYSPAVMELTPKSSKTKHFLNLIRIFFAPDETHLESIELHEPSGDYTKIIFSNVLLNQKLDQDIFLKE